MKFNKISQSKLKILLSAAECEEYTLVEEDGEYDSEKIKASLSKIFKIINEKTDFEVAKDRVLVQLYPLNMGGCEMFVTKLDFLPKREKMAVELSDNLMKCFEKKNTYLFSDIGDLLMAAYKCGKDGPESELYILEDGRFALTLRDVTSAELSVFDYLGEFGSMCDAVDKKFLLERGKPLCSDGALRRLYDLKEKRSDSES